MGDIILKVIPSEKCLNRNLRPILRNDKKMMVFDQTDKLGHKKQKNLISYPLSDDSVLHFRTHLGSKMNAEINNANNIRK